MSSWQRRSRRGGRSREDRKAVLACQRRPRSVPISDTAAGRAITGTRGYGTSLGGIEPNREKWGPLLLTSRSSPTTPRTRSPRRSTGSEPTAWRRSSSSRSSAPGRAPSAAGLPAGGCGDICRRNGVETRGRLGDLRLRSPRHVVRNRALEHRARHDHLRQGRDQRLPAARRAGRLRPCCGALLGEAGRMLRHGPTYAGHASCCAAALANIALLASDGLLERGQEMEQPLADALGRVAQHPAVAEVRAQTPA